MRDATSRSLGIHAELPALVDGWLQRADSAGRADSELPALIEMLREDHTPVAA